MNSKLLWSAAVIVLLAGMVSCQKWTIFSKEIRRRASWMLPIVLTFVASCTPVELDWRILTGKDISFNAIAVPGAAETKTVYSGQTYTVGTSALYERINWAVGDTIRIASSNCPEGFADYAVAEVSGDTNQNSSAQINPAAGNGHGLTWGEGAHDFYAVYPAPGTKGTAAGLSFSGGTSFPSASRAMARREPD